MAIHLPSSVYLSLQLPSSGINLFFAFLREFIQKCIACWVWHWVCFASFVTLFAWPAPGVTQEYLKLDCSNVRKLFVFAGILGASLDETR